jgi:hypothetical protein
MDRVESLLQQNEHIAAYISPNGTFNVDQMHQFVTSHYYKLTNMTNMSMPAGSQL